MRQSAFLRELIAAYRRCYPGVRLEILDGGRRDHLRAIRARQVDVAFFTGNAPVAGCDVEELWRERVHVAMAVQHPLAGSNALAWPQLRNERFIVSMSAIGTERRREQLAELQRRITEADQRLGRLFDAIKAGMVPESRAF